MILLTLNCNEVYKDSYVIWATIISLSLSKSSTDETISLIILSVDSPRNGYISQVECMRRPHLLSLHSVLLTKTQFRFVFFLTHPITPIYPHPIKHQFCFHSAVFTAVKILIVNLFICLKALPEPEFFFTESTCPGDTAKPAFDQCLILLDAQGCVV